MTLDDGSAFTGDLTPLWLAPPEEAETLAVSWQRLRDPGMTTINPGHGLVHYL